MQSICKSFFLSIQFKSFSFSIPYNLKSVLNQKTEKSYREYLCEKFRKWKSVLSLKSSYTRLICLLYSYTRNVITVRMNFHLYLLELVGWRQREHEYTNGENLLPFSMDQFVSHGWGSIGIFVILHHRTEVI